MNGRLSLQTHYRFMNAVTRFFLRAVGLAVLCASLVSCNVSGFFTSYEDEPEWVDPNASADAAAGNSAGGGPGAAVYGRICAACHLGSGKGVPANNIPPLAGSELVQGDVERPIKVVLHGLRGPITRNGVEINGQMASWKDQLSDEDIAHVLTYVRSSFGNSGSAVTPDEVKAVREATASQLIPYTESEL
jgi:mono/diheme cytochrome c family protein